MEAKDKQLTTAMIDSVTRPLRSQIDRLEKEVRRLKSDLSQTKTKVAAIKKNGR